MATFPASRITALVDLPVEYDLGESTSRPLRLRDLVDADLMEALLDRSLDYGTSRGDGALRELIAAAEGVAADQVLVTAGGISALFLINLVCCEPGDAMVLLTPCFPPVRAVPEGLGIAVSPVALSFDSGYRLDIEAVARALTPRTRVVCLASPQNPSGVRFRPDEIQGLLDVVAARAPGAVVLVDEVYRAATYGDAPVPPSAATLSPSVVTCSSLSKAHGLAGLRLGWLTTTRPELYERLRLAKFHTAISAPALEELIAARVLAHADELLAERARLLGEAWDQLAAWVRDHEEYVEIVVPDAGALCCLRLRADRYPAGAAERFYAELATRKARVAPGSWFGESDLVFRLGFGHLGPDAFPRALDRLGEALRVTA